MRTRRDCGHDPAELYTSSQGWQRCHACDRIATRRLRGKPDDSAERKPPGSPPRDVSNGKLCPDCESVKPLDEFYNNKRTPDGKQGYCIPCWKIRYHGPEYTRRIMLLRKYGITPERYDELLAEQGGGCGICGALPETQQHGVLPVDHDHATGEVRGLLCSSCNNGLGRFHDDADLLRAAIAYLG